MFEQAHTHPGTNGQACTCGVHSACTISGARPILLPTRPSSADASCLRCAHTHTALSAAVALSPSTGRSGGPHTLTHCAVSCCCWWSQPFHWNILMPPLRSPVSMMWCSGMAASARQSATCKGSRGSRPSSAHMCRSLHVSQPVGSCRTTTGIVRQAGDTVRLGATGNCSECMTACLPAGGLTCVRPLQRPHTSSSMAAAASSPPKQKTHVWQHAPL